jgi:hypothetical protein
MQIGDADRGASCVDEESKIKFREEYEFAERKTINALMVRRLESSVRRAKVEGTHNKERVDGTKQLSASRRGQEPVFIRVQGNKVRYER